MEAGKTALSYFNMLAICLTLVGLGELYAASALNVEIKVSTKEVQASATHTIRAKVANSVPTSGYIQVTFPQEYKDLPTGSVPCIAEDTSTPTPQCTFTGFVLRTTFSAPIAANGLAGYRLEITNPRWEVTLSTYQAATYLSEGQEKETQNSGISITFTASMRYLEPLKAAKFQPGSAVTGELSTWTVSLTTELQCAAGSKISVTFPFWNDLIVSQTSQRQPMVLTSSPTCTGTKGFSAPLSCQFASNVLSVTVPATAPGDLEFTVAQVRNPPTTALTSGFNIQTLMTEGVVQNSSGLTLTVQMTTPNVISLTVKAYSTNPTTVNTYTTLETSLKVTNPLPKTAVIQLTFPPQLALDSSLTGINGTWGVDGSLTFKVTGQTVQITNCFIDYFASDQITMNFVRIKTPASVQPTDDIIAQTMTSAGDVIDRSSPNAHFSASAGPLPTSSITPKVTTINALTYYSFKFTVTNPVPAAGGITITAPSDITLQNSADTACYQVLAGLSGTSLCRVESQRFVYVSNCFAQGFTGEVAIDVLGFVNPQTIKTTGNFVIRTYTDAATFQYMIDENLSAGKITATTDTLKSVEVTPKSLVTGQITTYTFKITTKNTILSGGYVTITFPLEVVRDNVKTACASPVGYSPTFQCDSQPRSVTITSAFNSDFPPGALSFELAQIRNPQSTKPSGTFTAATYTGTGLMYESLATDITVTMTTANQLLSASVRPSSGTVSATGDLTFDIQPFNPVPSDGVVLVTAPAEITWPSSFVCVAAGTLTTAVSCSVVSGQLSAKVTFAGDAAATSTFSFTVKSVRNPDSTRPTSSFKVTTTAPSYLIDALESGITFQLSTPNPITAFVQPATLGISEETTYTFTMNLKDKVPAGGYITVALPTQVVITTNKSCTFLGAGVLCDNTGGNVIRVNMFPTVFNPAQVVFAIAGLKNGVTIGQSGAFRLTTKTNDDYAIDESADQTVTFSCASNCETCDTYATRCTSCVSASSHPYLYSGSCHDICQTGSVDLGDKNCVPCDSNCFACFGTKATCTRCFTNGATPYLYSEQCVAKCPENAMVSSDFKCLVCDSNCKTCVDEATKCTSCVYPKVLYKNQCIERCPTAAMYNGNECLDCDLSCATCQGKIDQCTSCPAQKLVSKGKCVETCLVGTQIQSGQQCLDCDPSCYTCGGSITTCKSCFPGSVLVGTACESACPPAYTAINSVCQACAKGCTSCSNTVDNCTGCESDLFLHAAACTSSCPAETTILSGRNCLDCDVNCLTCKGATTNCASCGAGKLLYMGKCVDTCPKDVTVVIKSECFNCDSTCRTCAGDVSNCVSCYPGFSLYEGKCTSTCPSTHTAVNQVCTKCDAACLSCQGTANYCASCAAGLLLYKGSCLKECPALVSVLVASRCQECVSTCKTCSKSPESCDSCFSGSYLYNSACQSVCPSRYLPIGANCEPCDSTCKDCSGTPTTCISCGDGRYLAGSQCQPCDVTCQSCSGSPTSCTACREGSYLSSNTCVACDSACRVCSGAPTFCSACVGGKFMDGNTCLDVCPEERPIGAGQKCNACEEPCATCAGTTKICTTCINSELAMPEGSCVTTCPSGYTATAGQCESTCAPGCTSALLSNSVCDPECNLTACSFDNSACLDDGSSKLTLGNSETILIKEHPMPFSSAALLLAGFILASKAFVKSTTLTTTIVSIWGVVETFAWGAFCYYVYTASNTEGHGRRLLETDEWAVFWLFVLMLVAYGIHATINIVFTLYYTCSTCKRDSTHKKWREEHLLASSILVVLSTVLSFKLIRIMYSGLFGFKVCLTSFESKRAFFRPLLVLTYVSLVCTTVPYICLCVFAMVVFSSGNLVFIVALDTLSITILSLLVTVGDIIMMTHVVSVDALDLRLTAVALPMQTTQIDTSYFGQDSQKVHPDADTARSNEPFDKDLFTQEYLSGTEALPPGRAKEVSFELDPDSKDDHHERCQSSYTAIEPEGEHFNTPNRVETTETEHDLGFVIETVQPQESFAPRGESEEHSLDPLIAAQLATGTTPAPLPESTGEDELFNTRRSSGSPTDSFIDDTHSQAMGDFRDSQSQSFIESPQLLDTIPEESALELDSAEIDEYDPECIKVPLKPSGIKVLVKKSFDGAVRVDDKGEELPNAQPVDMSELQKPEIEVDKKDVRFGTVTASGSRMRLKRSFIGAKVVDIETTVRGEKRWLVGRTATQPEDFDLASAQPDPSDPGTVIVSHRPSGHMVRVQRPEHSPTFSSKRHPREFLGGRIVEVLPPTEPGSLMLYQLPIYADTPQSHSTAFSPHNWAQSALMSPAVRTMRSRKIKSSNAKTRRGRRSRLSSRSSSVASHDESPDKLQRIYGMQNAGLGSDAEAVQIHPRKRSKRRRFSTQHAVDRSVRSLEEIYLQRLEMPGQSARRQLRMPVFNPFFNSDVVDEDSLSRPANSPEAQYLNTQRDPAGMGLELLRGTPK